MVGSRDVPFVLWKMARTAVLCVVSMIKPIVPLTTGVTELQAVTVPQEL